MLERFTGAEGRRFIIEALAFQTLIAGDRHLAATLCDLSVVEGFEPGSIITQQGDSANDICFILSGSVSVSVHGRDVAVRQAGQQVGEMAVLDPGQSRSATLTAREEVVIVRVPASAFIDLANANPLMWRNVARSLADRLRQRDDRVERTNDVPVLFIGCSAESLSMGEAIKAGLSHAKVTVHLWTDNVFQPSTFTLESLENELAESDFAALVLAPDDLVTSRDATVPAPRDNVVFELGLFIGALGHTRTFLIRPFDADIKIPTDLAGFIPLTYSLNRESEPCAAVTSLCTQLINAINAAGPR